MLLLFTVVFNDIKTVIEINIETFSLDLFLDFLFEGIDTFPIYFVCIPVTTHFWLLFIFSVVPDWVIAVTKYKTWINLV